MSEQIDMDKIAELLGEERRGRVTAKGGYFGAIQLAAEVAALLRVLEDGGRPSETKGVQPDENIRPS